MRNSIFAKLSANKNQVTFCFVGSLRKLSSITLIYENLFICHFTIRIHFLRQRYDPPLLGNAKILGVPVLKPVSWRSCARKAQSRQFVKRNFLQEGCPGGRRAGKARVGLGGTHQQDGAKMDRGERDNNQTSRSQFRKLPKDQMFV